MCKRFRSGMALLVLLVAAPAIQAEIWISGPSRRVLRTEKAPAESKIWDAKSKTINLFAARNEFVAFQIVCAGELKGVDLKPFALKGQGSNELKHVHLFRAHWLKTPVLSQYSAKRRPKDVEYLDKRCKELGAPREFPVQLVPLTAKKYGAPFDVSPDRNEVIWTDIFVPEEAEAGTYNGSFEVAGQAIKVNLTVWNFTLPSVSHFPHWCYIGPEQIAWGNGLPAQKIPQMQEYFDAYFQMAHNHRISLNEGLGYGEDYIKAANRKYYDHYTGKAFKGPFAAGFGFELGTANQKVFELVKKEGWLNRVFTYLADEPGSKEAYEAVIARGKKVKADTGGQLMRFVTEQYKPSKPDWPHLDEAVDIFCSSGIAPSEIPAVEAKGNVVWTYNGGHMGSAALDAPAPVMRSQAWAGFVSGSRAWYFWEAGYVVDKHNKWKKERRLINKNPPKYLTDTWNNPLNFDEATKPWKNGKIYPAAWSIRINGDGLLFYPGKEAGVQGPISCIRMKNIRQGAQDFEYLYLLEKMGQREVALKEAKKLIGDEADSVTSSDGQSGKKKFDYQKNPAHWDEARIRLGNVLHKIGDEAIRAKIKPYNQYPNPVGHPDFYGGKRY